MKINIQEFIDKYKEEWNCTKVITDEDNIPRLLDRILESNERTLICIQYADKVKLATGHVDSDGCPVLEVKEYIPRYHP